MVLNVSGSNFVVGAKIRVDGNNCLSLQFLSSSSLRCTVPAGSVGLADVVVENPDLETAVLLNSFDYRSIPTWNSDISPILVTGGAKCASCHTTSSFAGVNINSYAAIMAASSGQGLVVNTANPKLSRVYVRTLNNSMPTTSNKLTSAEKQLLLDWIEGNAPEN